MRLEDCGFTEQEIERIRLLALIFNCQKITVEDIKK